MKFGALIRTAIAAALVGPAHAESMDAAFDAYIVEARGVVAAIDAGAAKQQGPALQSLADRANALIAPFIARFPVCGDYLKAAQTLNATWSRLSLERIEADYHEDGALPKIERPQDRALCYQMKDLLVHPLTGLRLLQDTELDVKALRHEIDEVVSHGAALKALVLARQSR
jgi:hypothetical protein